MRYIRVNPNRTLLAVIHTKQTEEMWTRMLEDSKDVLAESEAIHGPSILRGSYYRTCLLGLSSLGSSALSICKTLEGFIQSSAFCRVRMEAILALGHISTLENANEGDRQFFSF